MIYVVILVSILALVYAGYLTKKIMKNQIGTPKMEEISNAIHEGAMTFLNKEYKIITIFMRPPSKSPNYYWLIRGPDVTHHLV